MNTIAKGNRIQNEFNKLLKSRGFVTHTAKRTRFGGNDIFGCFDIVAKYPLHLQHTYYFQLSTKWKYGDDRKEIEAFPAGGLDRVYMVRKPDRKDFELLVYSVSSIGHGGVINREWLPYRLEDLFV